MRKLLLLLSLLLTLTLSGQTLTPGVVASQGTAAGSTYHAITQAALDAMTREPAADTAAMFDTFIRSMVDGGYWTGRVDLCYITCQGTNTNGEAYINWANPGTFNLTDPGATAPTFTPWQGFTGDQTSDYLSTNYVPSTDATNVGVDDFTVIIYSLTNANTAGYEIGAYTTSVGNDEASRMRLRLGGNFNSNINSEGAVSGAVATSLGTFIATRRGANELESYHWGPAAAYDNYSDTDVSDGFPAHALYILALNTDDTAGEFSIRQLPIAIVINAVSDAEADAINTIVETLMDDLGIGVQ